MPFFAKKFNKFNIFDIVRHVSREVCAKIEIVSFPGKKKMMKTAINGKEEFIWINSDLVFKHIFSNEEILRDFLNSFLEFIRLDLKIVSVSVSAQKFTQNDNITLHDYYLDIFAILSNKQCINLEMYNNFGEVETKKSLTYATMLYGHQLKKKESLKNAKKVISLNIINGSYKSKDSNILLKYELINPETGEKLLDDGIEMYLAPLDNLQKIAYSKDELRFITWLRFIYCRDMDEVVSLAKGDDIFMSAKEMVEDFVNDPEVIRLFHNDSWKEDSAELRGREQGIELGREQGLEIGREENNIEIAKKMLKEKCSISLIKKITNLTTSQIKTLL